MKFLLLLIFFLQILAAQDTGWSQEIVTSHYIPVDSSKTLLLIDPQSFYGARSFEISAHEGRPNYVPAFQISFQDGLLQITKNRCTK